MINNIVITCFCASIIINFKDIIDDLIDNDKIKFNKDIKYLCYLIIDLIVYIILFN